MGTAEHHKWYVLNADGTNVSEVIIGGPYDTRDEAVHHWRKYGQWHTEVALLDANKVARHLGEDARLREWLLTRSCHNPFQ